MKHLFGFLQIILESLPISSSGHLAIIGLEAPVSVERFVHAPTILVLMIYFWREPWALFYNWRFHWRKLLCWGTLIVFANSFTVLVYALLEKFQLALPLWLGFAITGCALLSLRFVSQKNQSHKTSLTLAGVIGVIQGFARLAGVSRLGVTYVAAIWLGFKPQHALRISCALQVPLFAAGFLEGAWDIWKEGELGYFFATPVIVAGLSAMIIAYYLLAWVEQLMIKRRLWYLGIYMIVPTFLVLFF